MDIEVKMPDIGLDEVEVIEILVNINETVELEQGLITVEGDKTSMEIPSPISGVVKNICVKVGEKIKTSSLIMVFKVKDATSCIRKEKENCLDENIHLNFKKNSKEDNFFHATPVVRRLARNLNIDLCNIIATGPKNRILKEDIELYQNNIKDNILKERKKMDSNYYSEEKIEELKLSDIQNIIGNNLHKNWMNIPHVTQFDEVDITNLEEFRKKYNNDKKIQKETSNCITILAFIIKVVAYALEKFPIFNSSLTIDNKKIILKKYINIGFAVDVNNDLFVPVLKNVDKKNIEQLSSELILLSEQARKRQLNISDTTGGCFTISNLGGIGGGWFSPIINSPEVAILGVSKSQIKPLWNGKEFIPSLMLPISLSYNHRVINGAYAARFITYINKILSDIHFLIM
ncbi:branched-chain alpha-keto acid dehydrogenase subunit E2 [Buchnera aphidicola str. Ak (Acyrthosiphon kondoi)]|uniref:Dihydrolipoamide acetyltransferase component of pyruvate dehydrogenase complex n=1 Tax=Buchnera aphidicola str. Ak (Acyrthosiphon kondoi) TaxID=1005090 RepID=G2LMS6_9GAMM|nr:2-oxo acid dehydrogenase subunit E2 [Buchnera aphidicola]AEO08564.1 branched-chain alpha-keto acid dehydrogenase subunit E2 [Buchnera aphidicola str. Ak (Acyrthosiphon kondoi)]